MSNWRQDAECAMQGADPEMFAPLDRSVGMIPRVARTAIDLYCRFCLVQEDCGLFADQTQTAGVYGGKYREIGSGKYRTYDPDTGGRTEVPFTEYHRVAGDRTGEGDGVDPQLIPTATAMQLLGFDSQPALARWLTARGVYPVRRSNGTGHANLYDPDEILEAQRKAARRGRTG